MSKPKSLTFSVAKILVVLISYLPALQSRPTDGIGLLVTITDDDDGFPAEDPAGAAFWWKLGISIILVLLGGVFAGINPLLLDCADLGLTLALLSQDEITVNKSITEFCLFLVASPGSQRR